MIVAAHTCKTNMVSKAVRSAHEVNMPHVDNERGQNEKANLPVFWNAKIAIDQEIKTKICFYQTSW